MTLCWFGQSNGAPVTDADRIAEIVLPVTA
jgi:hypothetical protein